MKNVTCILGLILIALQYSVTAKDHDIETLNDWGTYWEATSRPTHKPTRHPHAWATAEPTSKPSHHPHAWATAEPTSKPSKKPTKKPTDRPTKKPSPRPTSQPTSLPTSLPTTYPTSEPTFSPTSQPTSLPTSQPTTDPTSAPTFSPTSQPTSLPTSQPTSDPTSQPTFNPTSQPTFQPSSQPYYPLAPPTAGPTPYITHITATFTIYDAATVGNFTFYLIDTVEGPEISVNDCGVSQTCGNPQNSVAVQGISNKLNRTLTYFSMAIDLNAICLFGSDNYLYFIGGQFTSFGGNYTFNSAFQTFNRSKFPFPGTTSLTFLPSGNVTIGLNYTLAGGLGLPPWISASPVQLFSA